MMNRIRLLVVDDETRVRRGLAMRLEHEPDLVIVGEAADGSAALRLARELLPDVVVIDLLMSGMSGIQAIRILRAAVPTIGILAFSIRDDLTTRREASLAGATTFVAKQEGPEPLLAAIRRIAARRHLHDFAGDEDTEVG
ncbi:MAG: response regulator transcription factor [Dehalococcoidia bacterium]